jgi:GH25 family lysozyme M1 (1,4-beta-N-acetylmuramidase)
MRLAHRPRLALISAAFAASALIFGSIGATATLAVSTVVAQCPVNLRSTTSTSSTVVDVIATGATVTASASVSGGAWSATGCNGSNPSGTTWYKITAVNGTSTSSLYGRSAVYAATGLFKAASAPPPPTGGLAEGIDVSHWQGTINWSSVAAAGKRFAVMKATESTVYVDAQYAGWHSTARSVGIRVGAYHFAQPSTNAGDAVAEADWFVSHANITTGDLVPALDLEVSNGLSVAAMQSWVGSWLKEVYAKTGAKPMIYTSPSFWRTYLGDTHMFADQGYTVLWVAHWFVSAPSLPASNWGGKGWTFWQYSDCGRVSGISGCVDLDRFNGPDLTRVTYGASFSLAAAAAPSVKQGATRDIGISINRTWFTLPVTLSVGGLPAGVTATLSTTSTTGSAATLHVTTSKSGTVTPVGSYPITITAVSNGATRTTAATLKVTDGIAPTVAAPTSHLFAVSTLGSGVTPGKTHWSGTDAGGISAFSVQAQVNAGTWTTAPSSPTSATSAAQLWTFNDVHRFRIRATDNAGNTSAWAYGPSFKVGFSQDSSTSVHYGTGWHGQSTVYASGGSLHYTATAGASASFTFSGAGISWAAYRGPDRGSAKIYIDGAYLTTVSTYSATYASHQVVFAKSWVTNGTHTIKIVCVGTAGHARIDLDGFGRFVLS